MDVKLAGIATAVPQFVLTQETVLDWIRHRLGTHFARIGQVEDLFQNAGIAQRYSVSDRNWFDDRKTMEQRNQAYLERATELFVRVARAALDDSDWTANEVDAIVSISSTGIATPTLEARAHTELGFRDNVMRIPIFGLGCAGGVSGLSIARDIAAAGERRVLMVAVETCTLQFREGGLRKADIVAAALFGDGAAAVCLSGNPADSQRRCAIGAGVQKIWPNTLQIMGWNTRNDGLEVVFDRSIPLFVEEHLNSVILCVLGELETTFESFSRLVCHPGGTKVMNAIESCLGLPRASLDIERQVLRHYGNMSAPTVIFVLQRLLETEKRGSMLMTALGPGFTASFLPIEVNE